MDNIVTRKGRAQDAQAFSHLFLLSAPIFWPSLFGDNAAIDVIKNLFQQSRNLFSFEHSCFIEVNGKIAGMTLGYNWEQKRREKLYTSLLLVKCLKWSLFATFFDWLKVQNMLRKVGENEYYLQNIAVYPEFRGLGLGKKLLFEIEREAKKTGSNNITLDVDTSNKRAFKLYERIGYIYIIKWRSPSFEINNETLEFFGMRKTLEQDGNIA